MAVLGAFQVSEKGDLANWMTPERGVGSIGGAMDMVSGVRKVIVAMEHTTRRDEPRLVRECSYPLTARRAVNLVITDLAVIEVSPEGLLLKEVAPTVTPNEVQALTEPKLRIAADLREMDL